MAEKKLFDSKGNPVPLEIVKNNPDRIKVVRFGDMPNAPTKLNATYKAPAKDPAKEEPAVLQWLLAGGAGLAGYHIAQTIMDSIDEDGKKDKPMWRRLLSTLIPLCVAGASAYGGYRMGMPVKKAQSKEDRLASQEPILVFDKEKEDAEFGTPENPVTPWGRWLTGAGLGGGALSGLGYTGYQSAKWFRAPKEIGRTQGEVDAAKMELGKQYNSLEEAKKYNRSIAPKRQIAADSLSKMRSIDSARQGLAQGDPARIPLDAAYETAKSTYTKNNLKKEDIGKILAEIEENKKIMSYHGPNPELSWRRFSGRPAKTLLGGFGAIASGLGLTSAISDLVDFYSKRNSYHGVDTSELDQSTKKEVPVYDAAQFQQEGQGGN